jgi:hypothetical protein
MIGKLLFAAGLAGGVFYAYPLWNEHVGTPCQAVEQQFLTTASAGEGLRSARVIELAVMRRYLAPLSGGALAASDAKQRYPALPAEVGCAVGYWASLLDVRASQSGELEE